MDWLPPLLTDAVDGGGGSGGGGGGSDAVGGAHLQHAFNACALASLGNRVAGGWRGSGSGKEELGRMAFAEYNKALRATQAALMDGKGGRWKSDGVLAAVLLLGMFEVCSGFIFLMVMVPVGV